MEPISVDVINAVNGGMLLVAQKSDGSRTGISCDPALAPILRTFVRPSNARLARFWNDYEQDRGGTALLWDLIRIAEAVVRLGAVPNIRHLLRFSTATDVFHNACQATLMLRAHQLGRQPELIEASSDGARPDFAIHPSLPVEVKTLIGSAGVEVAEEGLRLPPPASDRLAKDLIRKVRDGVTQAGPDGVVAVAIWCDLAANAICRVSDTKPISELTFEPRQFILLLYPSEGVHEQVYTSGHIYDLPIFAGGLAQRLKSFTLPVYIPFTGRYEGVACSAHWQSVGRRIRIGSWIDSYAPYELTKSSEFTYQQLQAVVPAIERMQTARDAWLSLTAQQPLEARVYSADEVNRDPRFAALISLGVNLVDAVGGIRQLGLTEAFPEGRPRDDASTLWDELMGPDATVNIAALLSSRTSFFRMLRLSGFLSGFLQTAATPPEEPESLSD